MIDWNTAPWKTEKAASNFADETMDDLLSLRPNVLRDLGWVGIEIFRRSLMAAWFSRQIA